jgi:CBS domain-containing protein
MRTGDEPFSNRHFYTSLRGLHAFGIVVPGPKTTGTTREAALLLERRAKGRSPPGAGRNPLRPVRVATRPALTTDDNYERNAMKTLNHRQPVTAPILRARTAADFMTPNPVSIGRMSSVREAAAFLTARGISAAPVIDAAGRPIGVVSRSDILIHHQTPTVDRTPVHSVMTPAVFCVRTETPAAEVVETMVGLGVRRVFVVDDAGVLIGVVSAFDVLRELCS